MPDYLAPGVYVEEIPSRSKSIEGVETSVAAFVGLAPFGPLNIPQRIADWSQFERVFSDPAAPEPTPFIQGAYLPHAVYGFFQNGGTLCWVMRVGGGDLAKKVTEKSELVETRETAQEDTLLPGTYRLNVPSGEAAASERLERVTAIEEVTMVCFPDLMAMPNDGNGDIAATDRIVRALQRKVVEGCENAGRRMAILDGPSDRTPDEVLEWVLGSNLDSKFATMYWPWIEVFDPTTSRPLQVPPCGHVAGIWCRTDLTRGVHKAPANEVVHGASDLAYRLTGSEQDRLNRAGINCIRAFPRRGIRVWGARTLSSDPEWRYLHVRRLLNFVSESIMQGTQWAVFEPNDERLWMSLRMAAVEFLTRIWRTGALFGATGEQAFFVKCDEETNPPDMVEAGQVTIEIGIAPVKPAEFVVFRISQFQVQAGAE